MKHNNNTQLQEHINQIEKTNKQTTQTKQIITSTKNNNKHKQQTFVNTNKQR